MKTYQNMDEEDDGDIKYISNVASAFLLVSCFLGLLICLPIFFTNGYINYQYVVGNCTVNDMILLDNKLYWNVTMNITLDNIIFTHNGTIFIKGGFRKIDAFKYIYQINQTYICYQDDQTGKIYWADYQVNSGMIAWFVIFQTLISIITLCLIVGCMYGFCHYEFIIYQRRDYERVKDCNDIETMDHINEKL